MKMPVPGDAGPAIGAQPGTGIAGIGRARRDFELVDATDDGCAIILDLDPLAGILR